MSCAFEFPPSVFARDNMNLGLFRQASSPCLQHSPCSTPTLKVKRMKGRRAVSPCPFANREGEKDFRQSLKSSQSMVTFTSNFEFQTPVKIQEPSQPESAHFGLTSSSNTHSQTQNISCVPLEAALPTSESCVHLVSPAELVLRMTESKKNFILLDCRPFIAFNLGHIIGSLNLSCSDRFSKRRLKCGKANIVDFICGEEGKEVFKESYSSDIVLYDEGTTDLNDIPPTSPLSIIIDSLTKERRVAFVLKGGLSAFQDSYSHLCAKPSAPQTQPLYSPTTPLIEASIESATATEILPFLVLGNALDAANGEKLKALGVTHVLNCTAHLPNHFEQDGMTYRRLAASDSANQNLKQYFRDAFEFIDQARNSGGRILIHCQAGISRSATITIAYIMKHTLMTMCDAYKFVKGRRVIIAPNFNFMGQLLEFDEGLKKGDIPRELEPKLQIETLV